jgi:hypothetical protein
MVLGTDRCTDIGMCVVCVIWVHVIYVLYVYNVDPPIKDEEPDRCAPSIE